MNIIEKKSDGRRKRILLLLPLVLSSAVCFLFAFSLRSFSSDTLIREQEILEQGLRNGAVHTYALSGRYPESLSELLENYHITYDPGKFIVEYVPNGSNLFPMISVLPLKNAKGGLP